MDPLGKRKPGSAGAEALSEYAIHHHGMHSVLLLVNGLGRVEVPAALKPLPHTSRLAGSLEADRDPFAYPDRPLRITVAAEVANLRRSKVRLLASLEELNGVEVDALDGALPIGNHKAALVSVEFGATHARVTSTRKSRPGSSTYFDAAWLEALGSLGHSPKTTQMLAEAIAAQTALGNDFLVCPTLEPERDSRAFWGRDAGVATVGEVALLAGVKSRTFSSSLVNAYADGKLIINTGWLEDLTARRLAPNLELALAGALAPKAPADRRRAAPNLLAIRSLIRDLLLARDEIVILERREALGVEWLRKARRDEPVAGGAGNDLTYHVSYHLTAAMSAFSSILDQLAWVVVSRDNLPVKNHRDVGFDRLAAPVPRPPWNGARVRPHLEAQMPWSAVARGLALRALRNLTAHREPLTLGLVKAGEGFRNRDGPEVLAVWVFKRGEHVQTPDGKSYDPAALLADVGFLELPDLVLVRPRVLVEVAIAAAARICHDLLTHYQWEPRGWLRADRRWRSDQWTQRQARGRWSRNLWGFDEVLPTARALLR